MHEPDRGIRGWVEDRRFDVVGAVAGLLVAGLLFPLRFLSSQIYIRTLPVVIGVACVCYLLAVRRASNTATLPRLGAGFARVGPTLAFLGLSAMVALAAVAGERSVAFYGVAGLVGSLVLAQVAFLRERHFHLPLVLAQVLLLAVVVRFAALYTAPGFIGVDVWSHVTYVRAIVEANSLSAIANSKYVASPFFHLLTVAAADLYGESIRNGLYLSLGIAMPLSVLLVYATARLLVPARWAVFAAGCYAVADHAVRWGIHLIPTSMGLVFFLAVTYALVRFLQSDTRPANYAFLVLFSAATILTHQISSFIMLVLLGAALLGQLVLRFGPVGRSDPLAPLVGRLAEPANIVGLLAFDVGLITFTWSMTPYKGDTFLETVLNYLVVTLSSSAGFLNGVSSDSAGSAAAGGGGGSQFVAELATYLDTLGFLLLLGATVVGSLVVLRRHRASHATFTLLFSVVAMLFFVLGLPLFNVENFIPGRWVAFLYVPMAVLAVVGLRYLGRNLSPRVVAVGIVLFILVFPGVMLVSSDGTPDSPIFPSQNERLAYTDTELAAVHTIDDVTAPEDRPLYTDHPYATVFVRTDAHQASIIELRRGRAVTDGLTVYRTYQSHGGSFFRTAGGAGIRNPPEYAICPASEDHVYANGDVRVCMPPPTGG